MMFLELLKYYDMGVLYDPRKVNMEVDSLSWISMDSVAHIDDDKNELV